MVKLTKKSLDELAREMPVLSERELRMCVGGTGASYSEAEFYKLYMSGEWEGGVVDGWGNFASNIAVATYSDSVSSSHFMDGYVWANGCLWHNGYNLDGDYLFGDEIFDGIDSGQMGSGYMGGETEDEDEDRIIVDDPQLQALLDQLSPVQIQLIKSMGIQISVNPDIPRNGQYSPGWGKDRTKSIVLSSYDMIDLQRELVHAKQDNYGVMDPSGISNSNLEFQEYIMGNILKSYNKFYDVTWVDTGAKERLNFENWIARVTHEDLSKALDLGEFYKELDYYYEVFRSVAATKGKTEYAREPNENFKWDWNIYFDFFGIKY